MNLQLSIGARYLCSSTSALYKNKGILKYHILKSILISDIIMVCIFNTGFLINQYLMHNQYCSWYSLFLIPPLNIILSNNVTFLAIYVWLFTRTTHLWYIINNTVYTCFIVHIKVSIASVKFIPYFTGSSEKLLPHLWLRSRVLCCGIVYNWYIWLAVVKPHYK